MADLSNGFNFVAAFNEFVKNTKIIVNKNDPDDFPSCDDAKTKGEIPMAISRAKKDIMPRTLTRKKDADGSFEDEKFEDFANDLKSYFDDSAPDSQGKFDEWFKKECDVVEGYLKQYYDGVKFGKAQKLVNMTFKYLYCFGHTDEKGEYDENCRRDKEKYFRFCHMPIDSYIMEWAIRDGQISKDKAGSSDHASNDIPAWSNLCYDEYCNLVNIIDELIEKMPKDGTGKIDVCGDEIDTGLKKVELTPLKVEFVVWPKMTLQLEMERFMKRLKKGEKDKLVSKSLCDNLNDMFEILRSHYGCK